MSLDGLKILRDEGETRLGQWAGQETGGYHLAPADERRRAKVREAVREANDRIKRAEDREG